MLTEATIGLNASSSSERSRSDRTCQDAMPRYFIDYDDGGLRLSDEEGEEFASLQEARDAAIAALPDVGREAPPVDGQRHFVAYVRDTKGEVLCTVTLNLDASCHP